MYLVCLHMPLCANQACLCCAPAHMSVPKPGVGCMRSHTGVEHMSMCVFRCTYMYMCVQPRYTRVHTCTQVWCTWACPGANICTRVRVCTPRSHARTFTQACERGRECVCMHIY